MNAFTNLNLIVSSPWIKFSLPLLFSNTVFDIFHIYEAVFSCLYHMTLFYSFRCFWQPDYHSWYSDCITD